VLNQAIDVYHLQDFDKGSCFVQDASAQLAAPLLNPVQFELHFHFLG
jgi:16S rRNA (cytosine967-C5)-methyltransferase